MLSLFLKGLKWLCPCWLAQAPKTQNDEQNSDIQMIPYPFIKRVSSEQKFQTPLLDKQKYHTPNQQTKQNTALTKRFSTAEKNNQKQRVSVISEKIKDGDQFLSFKRSESLIKKNFNVIRLSGTNHFDSSPSLYDSITKLTYQNKQQYQQIIQNYGTYVQTRQNKEFKLKGTDVLCIHKLKKQILTEAQNQIQQFEYFSSDLDIIYENKEINMIVELKKQETMFESRAYSVLCKILSPAISMITLLQLFNSIQFQQTFNSFIKIKSVCKKPDVIIQVLKSNKNLFASQTLNILKFLTLLSEADTNKLYVMQIDTNISLQTFSNVAQDNYKKIVRIVRNQDNRIQIQILTEESFELDINVKPDEYYKEIYQNFAKYLIRKFRAM